MATGTPVIATNLPAIRELGTDRERTFFIV